MALAGQNLRGIDVCGTQNSNGRLKNSAPENFHRYENFPRNGSSDVRVPHRPPKHPRYNTYQSRFQSFLDNDWPVSMPQKPETLAEAGFYYDGVSDHVLCFSCDGGLKNWDPKDEPWTEHAKWFDQCPYLNLMKPRDFIENAVRERDAPVKADPTPSSAPSSVRTPLPESINHNVMQEQPSQFSIGQIKGGNVSFEINKEKSQRKSNQSHDIVADEIDPEKLKEENERLKDEKACRICYIEDRNIVFLPCGHLVTCPSCASAVNNCPVCRSTITSTVRVYQS